MNGKIPQDGKYGYFLNRNGYPYSRINAWVTQRDSHRTDAVPILLFIECSNNKDMKGAPFLCCVVSESSEDAGMLSVPLSALNSNFLFPPQVTVLTCDLAVHSAHKL